MLDLTIPAIRHKGREEEKKKHTHIHTRTHTKKRNDKVKWRQTFLGKTTREQTRLQNGTWAAVLVGNQLGQHLHAPLPWPPRTGDRWRRGVG